jgi:large subunit ribosomal protein L36e
MGLAPYEKRVIEILKINATKRAKKFLKRRLGTQKAGARKRQEMANIMAEMNKAQAAADAIKKEAEKAKKARKEAKKAEKAKKKEKATS